MKAEYDFSKAEQGKFYNSNATFHYPIYLEPDVDSFLNKIAEEKNIDVQILVNELLRKILRLFKVFNKIDQRSCHCDRSITSPTSPRSDRQE